MLVQMGFPASQNAPSIAEKRSRHRVFLREGLRTRGVTFHFFYKKKHPFWGRSSTHVRKK
jgi:hypothetical protein